MRGSEVLPDPLDAFLDMVVFIAQGAVRDADRTLQARAEPDARDEQHPCFFEDSFHENYWILTCRGRT